MDNFYATFENTYKYYGGAIDNIHQDSLGNIYATYKKAESETSETHFIGRVNDIKKIELNMGELWITYNSGETVNVGTIKGVNSMKVENDSLIVNYNDGTTANLGVVTAYEVAVENGFCEGQEMTDEEKRRKWYETMIDAADGFSELAGYEIAAEEAAESANVSATTAKKWAIRDGGNVIPSDTNNSQYYAQLSESWAKGNVTGFESQDENNAKYWAEQAADITADVDEALTAAQAAQHAAEIAQGHAESAQEAAETAQGLAEDAQDAAETAQDLAEDAQDAAETAQTGAQTAQRLAETAQDAAETAQATAERWATGGSQGIPTATNNALYFAHLSERYTQGTEDGSDDLEPGSPGADGHNAKSYMLALEGLHDEVSELEDKTERYARGTSQGIPVTDGSEEEPGYDATGYHDNAKYYKDLALDYSREAEQSANTAYNCELNSEGYKDEASGFADEAESWATGGSEGTPSATNNALYFSRQSENVMIDSEAWANGTRRGIPVMIGDPAYENNAKYWAEQASEVATDDRAAVTAAVYPIENSDIDAIFGGD